jgi:uncharacterized membrane protein/YHS domain-containing protein
VSEWLQVFGRLHPLVLHLPIGFLIALAVAELAARSQHIEVVRPIRSSLAWLAAGSAVLAATCGFVLSRESGYAGPALDTHLKLGISVAVCSLLVALLQTSDRPGVRRAYLCVLVLAVALLVPTADYGSSLTRGAEFLIEPLRKRAPEAAPMASNELTYAQTIAPIFASQCASCHGDAKKKAGLSLRDAASVLAGSKRGPILVPGKPEESEIVRRLRLPLDDDDHMPPEGKPQPAAEAIARIEDWIAAGAPAEGAFAARTAATPSAPTPAPVQSKADEQPPQAPEEALAALKAELVHAEPLAQGSHLYLVDFAAAAPRATDELVARLLAPVKEQVGDLSLSGCPITDAVMPLLAQLPRLRRLDLRATAVTDAGLRALARHPQLAELVLARTKLTDAAVSELAAMPALASVYLWDSGLSSDALVALAQQRPNLRIDSGEEAPSSVLEAEAAIVLKKASAPAGPAADPLKALEPINTVCPVTGEAVKPEFRVVYKGRVVGFCCPHCPSQFLLEPDKFASKLP